MALSHQLELDGLPCIDPISPESLPADLLIAGKDFWLSRCLSDIKEFNDFTDIWIFNSIPDAPQSVKKISALSAESLPDNENWEPFKVSLDLPLLWIKRIFLHCAGLPLMLPLTLQPKIILSLSPLSKFQHKLNLVKV